MFSAYLDESGNGVERDSFLAVGGLVSSPLQWGRLQNDWTEHLLQLPGMPRDEKIRPVPFHMTDFESGNWPIFNYGWQSEKSKSRFLNGLISIMCKRVKLRVFTVIVLEHYHTLFPRDRRKRMPWVISALGCSSRISKWAEKKEHDPIPFVFEQGGEGWGAAYENYCRLKKLGRIGKTKIGTWSMGDKHIAGLQAADLWAWELRQHFRCQLPGGNCGLRPSLEKLIYGVPDGAGFVLDGSNLKHLVDDLRTGTSTVEIFPFSPESLPSLDFKSSSAATP